MERGGRVHCRRVGRRREAAGEGRKGGGEEGGAEAAPEAAASAEGRCSNPDATIHRRSSVLRLHCSSPSFPQLQQTASGAGQSVRRAGGSAGTMQRVSVGPCFVCGEMGHLRMYCPKIQTQEKKWYESVYVCGEYRELCCRNIVGVDEGSVIDSGSGDVSKAGDKGGNREVTSKPLSFVNAPPEGCVWEQWGDLGVAEGM